MLLCLLFSSACTEQSRGCTRSGAEQARERSIGRMRVEDARSAQEDGRTFHEFTLLNGNGLGVNWVRLRMVYLDREGQPVGDWEVKFTGYIYPHDAVRKLRVDGGPVLLLAESTRYEIVDVRTTLKRPGT